MNFRHGLLLGILFSIVLLGFSFSQDAFSALFVDSKDVSGQETSPRAVAFNTDGTKMFVVGIASDRVHEYACGTAFDVSTCNDSASPSPDLGPGDLNLEATPDGLAFNTDGTKMFFVGGSNDLVREFNCTAFDVSTCVNSGSDGPNVSDTDPTSTGLAFNNDGTKMFIAGNDIGEYTCTTGFDVSSCTANAVFKLTVTGAQDPNPHDVAFNTSGTKMFIVGENLDNILEYTCTTGFLLSSCTYSGDVERFSVTNEDTSPSGIAFNSDGTKMFVTGITGQDVNEYTVPTAFDVSSLTAPSSETSSTGSGGSASKHNTKPTFGLDHKTHFQLIEGGFSFNDVPTDITHNYWTPYDKQSIKVGESNEFEIKVFASQQLRVQEFLFGIPVVGESHRAELGVEVFYDYSGEIEKVQVIQKTDIIDIDSIQIEKIKSKCRTDSSDERCVTTQLQMKFLEPLQDNVMAMKAIDFKGRSNITYLNDGFDISGDSLNPMKTMSIPGTEKYEGLIEITQTAKYSDVWVAADGRAFEINEYGSFKLINQTIKDREETSNNLDRYHSEFTSYKEEQINKAKIHLAILCGHCSDESYDKINDIFAYSYPITILKLDNPKIQKILQSEEINAIQVLKEIFEKRYPGKVFD